MGNFQAQFAAALVLLRLVTTALMLAMVLVAVLKLAGLPLPFWPRLSVTELTYFAGALYLVARSA